MYIYYSLRAFAQFSVIHTKHRLIYDKCMKRFFFVFILSFDILFIHFARLDRAHSTHSHQSLFNPSSFRHPSAPFSPTHWLSEIVLLFVLIMFITFSSWVHCIAQQTSCGPSQTPTHLIWRCRVQRNATLLMGYNNCIIKYIDI